MQSSLSGGFWSAVPAPRRLTGRYYLVQNAALTAEAERGIVEGGGAHSDIGGQGVFDKPAPLASREEATSLRLTRRQLYEATAVLDAT